MINPQELRIGNYIYYVIQTPKGICRFAGIYPPEWGDDNDTLLIICRNQYGLNAERGVEDYYPIPLTEEWMVRFGFKEWTGWYYLKLKSLGDEFTLCYAPNEDLLMLNIGEKTIKYENPKVHQLQNLVFALEGVELEMK